MVTNRFYMVWFGSVMLLKVLNAFPFEEHTVVGKYIFSESRDQAAVAICSTGSRAICVSCICVLSTNMALHSRKLSPARPTSIELHRHTLKAPLLDLRHPKCTHQHLHLVNIRLSTNERVTKQKRARKRIKNSST